MRGVGPCDFEALGTDRDDLPIAEAVERAGDVAGEDPVGTVRAAARGVGTRVPPQVRLGARPATMPSSQAPSNRTPDAVVVTPQARDDRCQQRADGHRGRYRLGCVRCCGHASQCVPGLEPYEGIVGNFYEPTERKRVILGGLAAPARQWCDSGVGCRAAKPGERGREKARHRHLADAETAADRGLRQIVVEPHLDDLAFVLREALEEPIGDETQFDVGELVVDHRQLDGGVSIQPAERFVTTMDLPSLHRFTDIAHRPAAVRGDLIERRQAPKAAGESLDGRVDLEVALLHRARRA